MTCDLLLSRRLLGVGGRCAVYLARFDGKLIAIKKLKKEIHEGTDEVRLHHLIELQNEAARNAIIEPKISITLGPI